MFYVIRLFTGDDDIESLDKSASDLFFIQLTAVRKTSYLN